MNKLVDRWHSPHLDRSVTVARWGHWGVPVLVFPTAGGDAEEIERCGIVASCGHLIEEGRIKVFSCDSISGRAILTREGDSYHLSWMVRRFVEFVGHELVPAIRTDSGGSPIDIVTAGASIGAFNALASLCRFPWDFRVAIGMSGTYDLARFLYGPPNEHFEWASPLHGLGSLPAEHLDQLRRRWVVLASGEGAHENIGESWHAAHVLGSAGVPNRVDPWGEQWIHDWPTWQAMLPHYLSQVA